MPKRARYILFTLIFCLLAAQLIRPERTNPGTDFERTIQAHTKMTPEVVSILERACQDCHANNTYWPWYSEAAPVSWLLISDVDEGRRQLNFSEWGTYSLEKQKYELSATCSEVKKGNMPWWYYKPLHAGAYLSRENVQSLCAWTEWERRRLQ